MTDTDEHPGIVKAIRIVGSERRLARELGVARGYLWRMRKRVSPVPLKYISELIRLTNNKVRKHDLRPDLW